MSQFDDEENLNQGQVTVPISSFRDMNNNLLFLQDRYTSNALVSDPNFRGAEIRDSHLNRTTNITRREAEVFQLLTTRAYTIKETLFDEEDYSEVLMFKIGSVINNEHLAIHDSIDGWKTKQLLTKEKKVTYSDQPEKKGGILSRFN